MKPYSTPLGKITQKTMERYRENKSISREDRLKIYVYGINKNFQKHKLGDKAIQQLVNIYDIYPHILQTFSKQIKGNPYIPTRIPFTVEVLQLYAILVNNHAIGRGKEVLQWNKSTANVFMILSAWFLFEKYKALKKRASELQVPVTQLPHEEFSKIVNRKTEISYKALHKLFGISRKEFKKGIMILGNYNIHKVALPNTLVGGKTLMYDIKQSFKPVKLKDGAFFIEEGKDLKVKFSLNSVLTYGLLNTKYIRYISLSYLMNLIKISSKKAKLISYIIVNREKPIDLQYINQNTGLGWFVDKKSISKDKIDTYLKENRHTHKEEITYKYYKNFIRKYLRELEKENIINGFKIIQKDGKKYIDYKIAPSFNPSFIDHDYLYSKGIYLNRENIIKHRIDLLKTKYKNDETALKILEGVMKTLKITDKHLKTIRDKNKSEKQKVKTVYSNKKTKTETLQKAIVRTITDGFKHYKIYTNYQIAKNHSVVKHFATYIKKNETYALQDFKQDVYVTLNYLTDVMGNNTPNYLTLDLFYAWFLYVNKIGDIESKYKDNTNTSVKWLENYLKSVQIDMLYSNKFGGKTFILNKNMPTKYAREYFNKSKVYELEDNFLFYSEMSSFNNFYNMIKSLYNNADKLVEKVNMLVHNTEDPEKLLYKYSPAKSFNTQSQLSEWEIRFYFVMYDLKNKTGIALNTTPSKLIKDKLKTAFSELYDTRYNVLTRDMLKIYGKYLTQFKAIPMEYQLI